MVESEYRFEGCTVRYEQGVVILSSNHDPANRFVWTWREAEAAADIFRQLNPALAAALRVLVAQRHEYAGNDRRGGK